MKIKLIIAICLYGIINGAVIKEDDYIELKNNLAIKNNYIAKTGLNNTEFIITLKDGSKYRKVVSFGDTQIIGKPTDKIVSLYCKEYGATAQAREYLGYNLPINLNKFLASNSIASDSFKVIIVNNNNGSYSPENKIINIEDFLSKDALSAINKDHIDLNFTKISTELSKITSNVSNITQSGVNLIKYWWGSSESDEKDKSGKYDLFKYFPGLGARGAGNTTTSSAKIAEYMLNLPSDFSQIDLDYNFKDTVKKWAILRDYFKENSQLIAIENCDKIMKFIHNLKDQLDQKQVVYKVIEKVMPNNYKSLIQKISQYYGNTKTIEEKEEIYINILKGAAIYFKLENNSIDLDQRISQIISNENDIKNLIWFFYALAINKNQGFSEGTFLIEDPNFGLYDYLSKFGLYRHSSHFKETASTQKGTDIEGLPADKRTLLFGKVIKENQDKDLTFIKPENFGVQKYYDIMMHGYEFVVAQARKRIGSDDWDEWRKERVPKEDLALYTALIKRIKNSGCTMDFKDKELNIHTMYNNIIKFLAEKENCSDKKLVSEAGSYINLLEQKYDRVNLRFGREVILTKEDINQFNNYSDFEKYLE